MDAEQRMKSVLAGFSVVVTQPVQWGEQDVLGHVNHVTYFRWYETARIAYFMKIGLMDMHRTEQDWPDFGVGGQRLSPSAQLPRHRARRRPGHADRPEQLRHGTPDRQSRATRSSPRREPPRWSSSITRPTSRTPSPRDPPRDRGARGADLLNRDPARCDSLGHPGEGLTRTRSMVPIHGSVLLDAPRRPRAARQGPQSVPDGIPTVPVGTTGATVSVNTPDEPLRAPA